ncbi:hypothetical protein [Saccharopolyspora taberi]|uniref:Uncharacterized protein n=1 Tax=Saccharopolyspora taberi TaxID=60895 RepID=A0ABN3V8B8_9PSEU
MSNGEFRIQVGDKTYTRDNLHEAAHDPNITPADRTKVRNINHGEFTGIQAGEIHGGITFGR